MKERRLSCAGDGFARDDSDCRCVQQCVCGHAGDRALLARAGRLRGGPLGAGGGGGTGAARVGGLASKLTGGLAGRLADGQARKKCSLF